MRPHLAAIAAVLLPLALGAQAPAVIAGDGWEAFPNVEYQGGDARFPKQLFGILVLTDSTLGFYPCRVTTEFSCRDAKGKSIWKDQPYFMIALSAVQHLQSSSRVRGASAGAKLMIGGLAGDRAQNFVSIVHETDSSAEAPLFQTTMAQSGAFEAKLRFRLKKLGRPLPEP
jgi:hypothetical protein